MCSGQTGEALSCILYELYCREYIIRVEGVSAYIGSTNCALIAVCFNTTQIITYIFIGHENLRCKHSQDREEFVSAP